MAPMFGRALALGAALALARLLTAAEGPAVRDAPLRAAIRLVQDGDLERGVVALDRALARLAPDHESERATGNLYLGMACLGLGQTSRARRHLRAAWMLRAGAPLDAKAFPPRVIALYEENRPPAPAAKAGKDKEAAAATKTARKAGVVVAPVLAGAAAGAAAAALLDSGGGPWPGAGAMTVRVFNCDDRCRTWLNGRLLAEVGLGQDTGRIDIDGKLAEGAPNVIAFEVANATGAISYGFEVRAGEAIVFQQLCGVAARLGCDDDRAFPAGVARRYEYVLAPREKR